MEKILNIIKEMKPGIQVDIDSKILEEDILDSFDMIMFVGELNEAFDVEIGVEEFIPENFESVKTIHQLINQLKEA